ncbi:MAG: hypothetical protein DIU76_00420 [Bacillota bacterium]|nr:MAG: hypothetical protein DIU76_00420 [Bacillota bacterium]
MDRGAADDVVVASGSRRWLPDLGSARPVGVKAGRPSDPATVRSVGPSRRRRRTSDPGGALRTARGGPSGRGPGGRDLRAGVRRRGASGPRHGGAERPIPYGVAAGARDTDPKEVKR